MGKFFIYGCGLLVMLANNNAMAQCVAYQINFQQTGDQYRWSMAWNSKRSTAQHIDQFTENAGNALENRSEVVQSMRWKSRGAGLGDTEAWVLVNMGVISSKKFFVRHCQFGESLRCQLDTTVGDGGSQINWMSTNLSCDSNKRCTYTDSGSIKGFGIFASPQKMSINVNTQSMKDALRLILASEHGNSAISHGFQSSRSGLDSFWNQSQQKLSRREKFFAVSTQNECR